MSSRPTISVCMMVRDEEAVLERALKSVRRHADEICVLDTGSVDRTPEIARRYADHYHERAWPGHFGRARNWSMEPATCDYIFILDADEYLPDPRKAFRQMRRVAREGLVILDVMIHNTVEEGKVIDPLWQTRLFPNDKDHPVQYTGAAHHQLHHALRVYQSKTGCRWLQSGEVIITHTGYDLTPEARKAKYRARIPLYARALAEATTPQDRAYYRYQLGLGHFQAGDIHAALYTLGQIDERGEEQHLNRYSRMHRLSVMCKCYLTYSVEGKAFDEQAAARVATRLAAFKTQEGLYTAGNVALAIGQRREALRLYVEAYFLEGAPGPKIDRAVLRGNIASCMAVTGWPLEAERLKRGGQGAERMMRQMAKLLEVAA